MIVEESIKYSNETSCRMCTQQNPGVTKKQNQTTNKQTKQKKNVLIFMNFKVETTNCSCLESTEINRRILLDLPQCAIFGCNTPVCKSTETVKYSAGLHGSTMGRYNNAGVPSIVAVKERERFTTLCSN